MTRRTFAARGALAFFVATVLTLALGASPASAAPILDDADAAELANTLAEATEEQDICYGWRVAVNDQDAGFSEDIGSSLGPGTLPRTDITCTRTVVFNADIVYTSELSESADYATFEVVSNFAGGPTGDDLQATGFDVDALLGDNDDLALFNAVAALPAIAGELGVAPPLVLEQNTEALPASDRPTGTPGSDRLRQYGAIYGITAVLILAGLAWFAYALYLRTASRRLAHLRSVPFPPYSPPRPPAPSARPMPGPVPPASPAPPHSSD